MDNNGYAKSYINDPMSRGATRILAVCFLASCFSPALAGDILPAPKQVSEHVYAWIGPLSGPNKENQGFRMNLVAIVGKKAVAVADTGYTEAMAREMLAHIARLTPAPVKYAINTSSQPHRYMGNKIFMDNGATIIARRKEVERMEKDGAQFAGGVERALELPSGSVEPPPIPDKIIDADMTLDLGGVTAEIKHIGATHTPAQLIVNVPVDKVVYAGDTLYGGRLLAVLPVSNVKSWINAYDSLKQFGDSTFIPGHGQPGKLGDFQFPTRDYLSLLFDHMEKMVEEGVDIQDAIKKLDQSRYSKLVNFEDLAGRNASWTYLEREAESFK